MKKSNFEKNQSTKLLLVEKKQNGEAGFYQDLVRKGFEICPFENGTAGIRKLGECNPDIIIINAASLRTNGQRIVSRFHNLLPETPTILIIGESEENKAENGANSVLQLPFTVQKLVNCIRLYQKTPAKQIITRGPVKLNLLTNMASCRQRETRLTPRLVTLLRILLEKPGEIHLREDLFKEVWQTDYTGDTRTLDVHISWLRDAIEENPKKPEMIMTVRGRGYKFIF
ncbi:MAG: response regulator transcription factor [Anaerolineaceae bacterium]|nr:response regulator transcription factor [Anaerolineaceae bacterium]